MAELMQQMRDPATIGGGSFFEVLYVGKIKVSHKRVPYTFIDDALPKFKAYDAEKLRQQQEATRKQSTPVSGESSTEGETPRRNESDNRGTESTPPAPDDPPEVFQGRRVSTFDIPTKKIENDTVGDSNTSGSGKEEPKVEENCSVNVQQEKQQPEQEHQPHQPTSPAVATLAERVIVTKETKSASPQEEE
uniref:Uncharacterized protein n=1 Tax=Anopheles maculatus TaxID=74869 RepID=A0A182SBB2_9DIPT